MTNLYRIKTVFTGLAGSPYLNTMYFREIDSTAQQAADRAAAFWNSADSLMHTDLTWDTEADVEVIDDTSGNIVRVDNTTPSSGAGGLTADVLPMATQGLIRLRTGSFVGGREIRGKIFVPGLTESASTAGQPNASAVTTLETAATALIAAGGANLVVYSRKNGTYAEVVSSSMWTQFAVLRSRRD